MCWSAPAALLGQGPVLADFVAKRFCVRREAILIQRINWPRTIDSSAVALVFERCAPAPVADFCNSIGTTLT
jgi:hypothetical protein